MIKLRRYHDDHHKTDKFIWINPAHIVSMWVFNTEHNFLNDQRKLETKQIDISVINPSIPGTDIRVMETPEEIVALTLKVG